MTRGKLIVFEGTDCSGKETQSKKLVERLKSENIPTIRMTFPQYEKPTGKIVGGPYLGKPEISNSWFEDPNKVDPKIACLYYAADRLAAQPQLKRILESGTNIICDRYVESNMGHQAGKIEDSQKRIEMINWIYGLEYSFLGLEKPSKTLFLYMPYQVGIELKKGRAGESDGHERNPTHLKNAERAYLELQKIFKWSQINCAPDGTTKSLRSIEEIHNEIYDKLIQDFAKI